MFPEYKKKKATPAKTMNTIVKMYFLCSLLIINQTNNKKTIHDYCKFATQIPDVPHLPIVVKNLINLFPVRMF